MIDDISLETRVLELARQAFLCDVSMDDDFFDIGATSLSIAFFAGLLSQEFAVDVDATDVFQAGTLRRILSVLSMS